eukprot:CAMPEP_0203808044 /NCGR_PEP_ID=MMETSP0115-20131106/1393_1 /ASSEMBLY_ACC=CAM_ASM_000227 /TAXON_ID=33651 /ORGANISM="Bicosoecid sp, Strain ms1" /LENGTH=148 /DNA_ID=CAMNT_0050716727 /DNA_START=93 /DNA_END=537 /DNA_ORIENTATION=+
MSLQPPRRAALREGAHAAPAAAQSQRPPAGGTVARSPPRRASPPPQPRAARLGVQAFLRNRAAPACARARPKAPLGLGAAVTAREPDADGGVSSTRTQSAPRAPHELPRARAAPTHTQPSPLRRCHARAAASSARDAPTRALLCARRR